METGFRVIKSMTCFVKPELAGDGVLPTACRSRVVDGHGCGNEGIQVQARSAQGLEDAVVPVLSAGEVAHAAGRVDSGIVPHLLDVCVVLLLEGLAMLHELGDAVAAEAHFVHHRLAERLRSN
eukprot:1479343-Lingulodinium_polyedra.AAC.1